MGGSQDRREVDSIIDTCVGVEGKRWYEIKWKSGWVPEDRIPSEAIEEYIKPQVEKDGKNRPFGILGKKHENDFDEYLICYKNSWEPEEKLSSSYSSMLISYWAAKSRIKDVIKVEDQTDDIELLQNTEIHINKSTVGHKSKDKAVSRPHSPLNERPPDVNRQIPQKTMSNGEIKNTANVNVQMFGCCNIYSFLEKIYNKLLDLEKKMLDLEKNIQPPPNDTHMNQSIPEISPTSYNNEFIENINIHRSNVTQVNKSFAEMISNAYSSENSITNIQISSDEPQRTPPLSHVSATSLNNDIKDQSMEVIVHNFSKDSEDHCLMDETKDFMDEKYVAGEIITFPCSFSRPDIICDRTIKSEELFVTQISANEKFVKLPEICSDGEEPIHPPSILVPRETVVNIEKLMRNTKIKIRHQFGLKLVAKLFKARELAVSNCSGTYGSLKLDAERLRYIKKIVFNKFPCGRLEREDIVWKDICKRIDNKHRHEKRRCGAASKSS